MKATRSFAFATLLIGTVILTFACSQKCYTSDGNLANNDTPYHVCDPCTEASVYCLEGYECPTNRLYKDVRLGFRDRRTPIAQDVNGYNGTSDSRPSSSKSTSSIDAITSSALLTTVTPLQGDSPTAAPTLMITAVGSTPSLLSSSVIREATTFTTDYSARTSSTSSSGPASTSSATFDPPTGNTRTYSGYTEDQKIALACGLSIPLAALFVAVVTCWRKTG